MNAEEVRAYIGVQDPWDKRQDGLWLETTDLDVSKMAEVMADAEARFITITARPADSGCRLAYHWDLNGQLLTFITYVNNGEIASIYPVCEAADWIEREIHDYYAVRFTGRPDLACLVLRSDQKPGMFHWDKEEEKR